MQIFSAFLCTPTDFKVVFYTLFMHKTVKYPKKKMSLMLDNHSLSYWPRAEIQLYMTPVSPPPLPRTRVPYESWHLQILTLLGACRDDACIKEGLLSVAPFRQEIEMLNREVEKKDRENKSRAAEVQQLRIELQRYISEVNNQAKRDSSAHEEG